MATPRILPVINAIGCLALTGIIVAQWNAQLKSTEKSKRMAVDMVELKASAAEETARAALLEQDISTLKETLEAMRVSNARLAQDAAVANLQKQDLEANREAVKGWEAAVAERDVKLKDLNSKLTATRERLDQAIGKLKAAGAR